MEQLKKDLVNKLQKKNPTTLNMVVGFDGFVDEIIHVVDKRLDSDSFTRIETILDLSKRIEKASGLSTNIELISTQKKIGGNGPIMCNALAKHAPSITYIGALGYPTLNDVFIEMSQIATLYTVAENGHTDALEFNDGKLMLGKMVSLKDVTYEKTIETIGFEKLLELLSQTDLFASVNWSMLPNMTDFWQKLLIHVLPHLPKRDKKPIFFIDLADPEKREAVEIIEALDLLKSFTPYFKVVLGLNKKEAYDVANVLERFDSESLEQMQVSLEDLNMSLYQYLKIDAVVIHPVDRSCVVIDGAFYEASGPYVKKPKLTTGAGDNFNAGFVLGLLLDLDPTEALLVGMSTSGYYVRQAKSPTYTELVTFITDWSNQAI
ncbi:MAG: PfkB family carbohydrate kinase [Acholeplasmataceae bacterium]